MKTFSKKIVLALFFAGSALAQRPDSMPGMKMQPPAQTKQQPSSGAKPDTSKPTAHEEHGMGQMQMEMHSPEDITSNVSAVQEPENPEHKTGSNLPVADLLEAAKAVPPKTL